MKCPNCNVEMQIISNKLRFEGDESPDTETKAIRVLTLKCRNTQCVGHTEVVEHTEN